MDLDKLHTLVELARLGTMSAVARSTGYGTSTVSQQLAALERQAGVSLLEASGRRVRLTPAGRRLAEHGRGILAAVTAAELDLADRAEPHGLVRVGGFTTALRHHVLPAFVEITATHPSVSLEVCEGEPDEVIAWLENDEIDLGFVYDYTLVPRTWRHPSTLISTSPMLLAVADDVDVPDRIRVPADLDGLRGLDWIGNSRDTGDDELSKRLCALAGWTPTIRHRSDSISLVVDLVLAGQGVSVIVGDSPEARRVRTVALDLAPTQRRLWTIVRDGEQSRPATRTVIDQVRATRNAPAGASGSFGIGASCKVAEVHRTEAP